VHATPFRSGLAFDKSLTIPEVSTNVYGQSLCGVNLVETAVLIKTHSKIAKKHLVMVMGRAAKSYICKMLSFLLLFCIRTELRCFSLEYSNSQHLN